MLSIRASLTSWFVGLTFVLLVTFSSLLYISVSGMLMAAVDGILRTRAQAVAAFCDWEEGQAGVEFEIPRDNAAGLVGLAPGRAFEIFTLPELKLLYRSGETAGLPERPDFTNVDNGARARFDTLAGSPPRRIITASYHHDALPAADREPARRAFDVGIRVADSLAPYEEQRSRVAWAIVILTALSTLVVVAFGLFISKRFVKPLRELGAAAAAIRDSGNTTIPRRGNRDEVDVLAAALESSFAALQESLSQQKRFTANAAHELRNPISVIRSAAEVALRNPRTEDQYREFFTDVVETADRMGSVVEALLLLARIDAGAADRAFAPVELLQLSRDCINSQKTGRERLRVEGGEPASVNGDARLLAILINNLISNALRYSNKSEPIVVSVARGADGTVILSVRDRGPGVPPAESERVFERFHRLESTDSTATGAGLGLAIVREIARAHGAVCNLESSGEGTLVSVVFGRV
ncbi:MAG: HAMP domain-containing histidine kinase [Planctomycetes bacterium]|nr:HAMP domain-containing histidine kinase [Planctomycetota bacterium]